MKDFKTLEEAKEYIIELEENITTLEADKKTLSEDNESVKAECETLRTINQKYYNKLIAQESSGEKDEEEETEEAPKCDEFAKSIISMF